MDSSKTFKNLIVWQKAHAFVLSVYSVSGSFPKEEIFSLTSQFRRAAVSIAANIAEGYAKRGKSDKLRFFNIAQGSLEECRYYIVLCFDLKYSNTEQNEQLTGYSEEISKLLNAYCKSIADSLTQPTS